MEVVEKPIPLRTAQLPGWVGGNATTKQKPQAGNSLAQRIADGDDAQLASPSLLTKYASARLYKALTSSAANHLRQARPLW